jgi:hypothetical protein
VYPRISGGIGKCGSLLLICNEYRIDKRLVMATDAEQARSDGAGVHDSDGSKDDSPYAHKGTGDGIITIGRWRLARLLSLILIIVGRWILERQSGQVVHRVLGLMIFHH